MGNLINVVSLLLAEGVDINIADSDGNTPLHVSVENGASKMSTFLIEKGANTNVTTKNGKNLLHLAALGQSKTLSSMFLEQGLGIETLDNDGFSPLHLAIQKGSDIVAQFLIKKGANVHTISKDGSTLLHTVARAKKEHVDIVSLLLENKLKIDATDKNGKTPLQIAKEKNFTEIVSVLTGKGNATTVM